MSLPIHRTCMVKYYIDEDMERERALKERLLPTGATGGLIDTGPDVHIVWDSTVSVLHMTGSAIGMHIDSVKSFSVTVEDI